MTVISGPFPPTPTPSLRSRPRMPGAYEDFTQAGPSKPSIPPPTRLPPTPPVHEMLDSTRTPVAHYASLSYDTPPEETRYRSAKIDTTRRPHTTYPQSEEPVYHPHRKYTDPTPHTGHYTSHEPASPNNSSSHHQLDVDLDVYSQDYDVEDDPRQPTLSFVTTSTADSTTSSPSINEAYTYGTERIDGKVDQHEPRIRVRTNLGRQHAYSSAESSMASGAYSYHAYSDNSFHINPPPLPTPEIGLGNSRSSDYIRTPGDDAPSGYDWSGMNRDRSHSTSSALSSESTSSADDHLSTSFQHTFSYLSDSLPGARNPWEETAALPESNAVAMVGDGRSVILDREKLEAMGGIRALRKMSENELLRLPRYTHLLLSSVGSDVLSILPSLLDVLSATLVVLDVSNNDLSSLPPALRHCTALEELNISGNPLRQLPSFLGECYGLQVLQADSCTLGSLPVELSQISNLHTLCVRNNKLIALPPWLCLLTHLEILRVEGNPFPVQWQSVVAPILPATLKSLPTLRTKTSQQSLRSMGTMSPTPSSSVASSIHQVALSPAQHTPTSMYSQSGHGGSSVSLSDSRPTTPAVQSLRTTRNLTVTTALSKRPETPLSPFSPASQTSSNRSVTGPTPSSDYFGSERPGANTQRRVQSAKVTVQDHDEVLDPKSKWGFLRKVSMSRLRTEKGAKQLSASAAANVSNMPGPHTISSPISTSNPAFGTISSPLSASPRRPPLSAAGWSSSDVPTRRVMPERPPMPGPSLSTTSLPQSLSSVPLNGYPLAPASGARSKRRSFLPIDPGPPSLNVSIPSTSPFMAPRASLCDVDQPQIQEDEDAVETLGDEAEMHRSPRAPSLLSQRASDPTANDIDRAYQRGLESIKSYLRDLCDLGLPATEPYGGFEVVDTPDVSTPGSEAAALRSSVAESSRSSRHQGAHDSMYSAGRGVSMASSGNEELKPESPAPATSGKRFKDDKVKRVRVIREILETEKTYVRGLGELVTIYVRPATQPVNTSKSAETVIPAPERKVVFGGVESVLIIHRDNFLPALERVIKPLLDHGDDEKGELSARVAHQVGEVFRTYIAYMKQYSTYINNFDNALSRMRSWVMPTSPGALSSAPKSVGVAAVGAGLIGSAVLPAGDSSPQAGCPLTPTQRKRVKQFLKRCKQHPQHSQINLESYLLLPVQRVPRYKMLLEDLAMCTPPRDVVGPSDALDDAISEISNLASLMNEEKRESESRLRLLHWQQRITSRGPSPLVQPHRKLILDGALNLIRVVKKASTFVEVDTTSLNGADGDSTITGSKAVVPVDYIKAEPMDKPIMLILCSDMLVLVQKRSGEGWEGQVDLFTVMRMATLREPASVSSSNDRVLRVVDNKSIYYFNGGSASTTLQWCRAINGQNRQ